MENMDKELTVPKWVLIVQPKIPQMPQKISAQNVCSSSRFLKKNSLGVHSPCLTSTVSKVELFIFYMKNRRERMEIFQKQINMKADY